MAPSKPSQLKTRLPIAPKLTDPTDFFKAFGGGSTNDHPHGIHASRQSWLNGAVNDSFFDDAHADATMAPPVMNRYSTSSDPTLAAISHPLVQPRRPLSPPESASVSPKSYLFDVQDTVKPNVLTNDRGEGSYSLPFGQVTPPDDGPLDDMFEGPLQDPYIKVEEPWPESRTQAPMQIDKLQQQKSTPSKRARKYTPRKPKKQNLSDLHNPGDARRSKFLERNRVAASKCRQKKKEWTQGLERRARDLQKDRNNLRVLMESLREELYYLKTQCMEHRDCECDAIRNYLNDPTRLDDTAIPHERRSSVEVTSDGQSDEMLEAPDVETQQPQQANDAKAVANDEQALTALLTSSIEFDANTEGKRLER